MLKTVEYLDDVSSKAAVSMGTARLGLGKAVCDRMLDAVGGFNGAANLNTVEYFDRMSWKAAASMRTARSWLDTAVY